VVGGGGEPHVAGGEAPACLQQDVALCEVEAAPAHPAAGRDGIGGGDPARRGPRILLQQDAVRALGDVGAGEDAHRLAGAERARIGLAGGGLAHHAQGLAGIGLGGAHGIAVHGREIGGRLGHAGLDGGGQYPAPGLGQRHRLGGHGGDAGQDARLGLGHGNHGAGSVKLPDLPPSLCTTRSASMRMPRSTAFTMS